MIEEKVPNDVRLVRNVLGVRSMYVYLLAKSNSNPAAVPLLKSPPAAPGTFFDLASSFRDQPMMHRALTMARAMPWAWSTDCYCARHPEAPPVGLRLGRQTWTVRLRLVSR